MDLNSTEAMAVSTFLCIAFSCRPYMGAFTLISEFCHSWRLQS